MHIEPGIVTGAKIVLSFATASGVGLLAMKLTWENLLNNAIILFVSRCLLAVLAVFAFFEILPHYPIGISEVHFIFGSSLFLLLGAAPAAIGLALGLFIQSFFLSPLDLPQYGMNITTLLVPLFGLHFFARKIIAPNTAYVDLRYRDVLKLSAIYQGGIVGWVIFWAVYGQGFGAENIAAIASFSIAYLTIIIVEPLVDMALLAGAKRLRHFGGAQFFARGMYQPG